MFIDKERPMKKVGERRAERKRFKKKAGEYRLPRIRAGESGPPGEYDARISDDGRFEVIGPAGTVKAPAMTKAVDLLPAAKATAKAQGELLGRLHQIDEVLPTLYRIIGEAATANAVLPHGAIQVRDFARTLNQRRSDLYHQYDNEGE